MACHKQGTVTAFPGFNAEDDCKKLRSAMKGIGTDEKAVIAVICYRSNAQRQELKVKYKSMYGKDLIDEFKSELSGDFRNAIQGLMLTPADFDATCIKNAVKGLGTDEAALIEVITSRSSEELQAVKVSYKKLFGKELEKAVASDLSGDFKRIMVSLICAHREPEGDVDTSLAARDAKTICDAGEKVWGTDEAMFNSIFAVRSFGQLQAMYREYEKISKNSIETAIKKEMSGDLEKAYLAIFEVSKDLVGYFVGRLHKSMKGLGTDEETLTRVMVSRCEVDMEQIKGAFQAKYGKSLYSFIKDDISGDYERTLLALCRD